MQRLPSPSPALALPAGVPFSDPASVDAWDAWFRWREEGQLRDISIDATWQRVAIALSKAVPPDEAPHWEQRLRAALTSWCFLPDERILATAGTRRIGWTRELSGVINVAAAVRYPLSPRSNWDAAAYFASAQTGLCALRCAAALVSGPCAPVRLTLGVVGFADALALLDIPYASDRAIELARQVREHIRRAVASTRHAPASACAVAVEADDGNADSPGVIAVSGEPSHPRLALLANNLTDGLEPLNITDQQVRIDGSHRTLRSSGMALEFARRHSDAAHVKRLIEGAQATLEGRRAIYLAFGADT
ncbi:hypothetical protein [Tahibacter amnicola]|uniref:Uncharacterized protein n=1 Tax=Tahibacter amnicola TaxID=2976241 RepID=A0ABY6BAA2_9GAMM|nr:hypothetical protein [Tahibacter amnicola]UXI66466.1 hypothetical protein N4264_17140 [Tahibacter amnicola]